MTTRITTSNIETTTLVQLVSAKITNIEITDSSYTVLDDTAVDIAGGYILVTGTGFESGCQVVVNNTAATSVTFVSATQVRAQVPATAAGTYIVYLVNPTGGVAIRVNGITFSGTPTWVSDSALVGVVDTAISIQLTATDATTFALAAGSALPPGVTLSSGGLLSGTITGITEETVYNFTINAVDAELQDSPRSFAFTVTAGDQYFNLTTLLLPGAATTFVRDASSNNFAVTVAGDTRPNTFNPYLTGWSNYFDGTGDYITAPSNSAFALGTEDFTIETWVYRTGTNPENATYTLSIFDFRSTEPQVAIFIGFDGGNAGYANKIYVYVNGGYPAVSTTSIALNTWYHVAYVRSGATAYLYINGVMEASSAISSNFTTTTCRIGSRFAVLGTDWRTWQGYISNARIVKGTAVYTADFTPPTAPLTAVANTSLLTCADNRFIDDSTNNFVITRTGDVAVGSFSPFAEPATTLGSTYFAGGGNYLSVASTSAFAFGTGDFTVEAWVYPTSLPDDSSAKFIIDFRPSTADQNFVMGFLGPKLYIQSTSGYILGTTTVPVNTWVHCAYVKSGNTVTVYLNGVSNGSTTMAYSQPASAATIGSAVNTTQALIGYISNLRIVKGTAIYTANFTPPTTSLTAITNTSLLTLQTNQPVNNSQFLDSSSSNFPITRAGNTTQGTFSPYSPSGWSNYFDGTGDYLTVPNNAALAFGAGDFCLEFWIYTTAFGSTDGRPLGNHNGWAANAWSLHNDHTTANEKYTFWVHNYSSGSPMFTSSSSVALNTWTHVAVTRSGTSWRMFVNGVQEGSTVTSSAALDGGSSDDMYIGGSGGGSEYVTGYMSNVRVVKGAALYTENFTPSTQPLTAIAGTSLLTCQSSGFADLSPNRLAVTRAGDVRVTNFAPFKAATQTPTSYSAYFDGSGDYITAPSNAVFQLGTDAYTIEAWLYTSVSAVQAIVNIGTYISGLLFRTNNLGLQVWTLGGNRGTSTTGLTLNAWNHVALVRNTGGTCTLYINGSSNVTFTDTGSISPADSLITIGVQTPGTSSSPLNGYLSNLRIVKGTAVYTADFTPPTQPLTAIAGTSLLTCQSATFVDNSTNNFAITAAGNSQPTTVNPFGSTFTNSTGYTAAEYGGSVYFDGTGDYLTVPSTNALAFGTGDFTIECWAYFTSVANFPTLTDSRATTSSTTGFNLGLSTAKVQLYTTSQLLIGATTLVANTWYHIAVTRAGATLKIWLNGVQDASVSNSTNWSDTTLLVGSTPTPSNYMTGYISNLRLVKGQALYTSNFVPPLAPVDPVPNTTLLLNGTSAAITDATTKNVLETVGDAKISTAVAKFGSSSMAFDGTVDALFEPANVNYGYGTGDFTIEFWVYFNAVSSDQTIASNLTSGSSVNPHIYLLGSGSTIRYYTNNADRIVGSAVSINTWYHVAVSRSAGSTRLFINGTQTGSTYADSNNYGASAPLGIGTYYSAGAPVAVSTLNGYIQDLRVTRGHARYTANFTPPAAAFQLR